MGLEVPIRNQVAHAGMLSPSFKTTAVIEAGYLMHTFLVETGVFTFTSLSNHFCSIPGIDSIYEQHVGAQQASVMHLCKLITHNCQWHALTSEESVPKRASVKGKLSLKC